MGLFKSEEQKQLENEEKIKKIMEKYELSSLAPEYQEAIKNINAELSGNKLINLGTSLSGTPEDTAKLSYLSALVQQNWIIIRLLDELNKKIK